MLKGAARAAEMFADLAGRTGGKAGQLSGSLIVTVLSGAARLVMPTIRDFHLAHSQIALEFIAGARLARLQHGEAHVAIRAGAKPEVPDYVVTLFRRLSLGLYASQGYIDRLGHPNPDSLDGHRFVGSVAVPRPVPYAVWIRANVRPPTLALHTTDQQVLHSAVCEGLGLGFLAYHDARGRPDLAAVIPPGEAWSTALWTLTHVDLHRTRKVQAFVHYLKALRSVYRAGA